MNINEAKDIFDKILINKSQNGGYTNASEFNLLAKMAQMELFDSEIGQTSLYKQNLPKKIYEDSQRITDDLQTFKTNTQLATTTTSLYSYITIPTNYAYFSSARVRVVVNGDCESEVRDGYVKMLPDDKVGRALRDALLSPTTEFPIGTILGGQIRIYPKEVRIVDLTYLRYPSDPVWGFTVSSGRQVYSSGTSTQFEFPAIRHNSILIKMLSYKGITIREGEVIQFANMKDNAGV